MNFEMDGKNYAALILTGQPTLNNVLSLQIHEALKQSIVINYNFADISAEEVKKYIINRLELCGVKNNIFKEGAVEALGNCCNGSIRKLNNLVHKSLMIGCELRVEQINTDIIMDSNSEIELI